MANKASSAEGLVLAYIQEQNRPLNAQCIADALQVHGLKKTAIQKALDSLSGDAAGGGEGAAGCGGDVTEGGKRDARGRVWYKDYGKQRIYLARQDLLAIPSAAELEGLRQRNGELQGAAMQLREECSVLNKGRSGLEASLTLPQIQHQISQLTTEIGAMEQKLTSLRGGCNSISSEKRRKSDEDYSRYVGLWRKRKRIFQALWETVTDNFPRDLKDFKDELGLELDEDAGCSLAQFDDAFAARRAPTGSASRRRTSLTGTKRREEMADENVAPPEQTRQQQPQAAKAQGKRGAKGVKQENGGRSETNAHKRTKG